MILLAISIVPLLLIYTIQADMRAQAAEALKDYTWSPGYVDVDSIIEGVENDSKSLVNLTIE